MVGGKEERREMSEAAVTFSFHVFTAVGTLSLVLAPAGTRFRFLENQAFYAANAPVATF